MLRLLADENFNNNIIRGLLLRVSELDIIRVQDVELVSADDPAVLAWAAANDRIVLTHDLATMSDYAYARVSAGEDMPGVFHLSKQLPVGAAIDELMLVNACSEQSEWSKVVAYLPL